MGETDPAVELGVAGESLFDAWHLDGDDAYVAAVEVVADLLEAGGFESVGFVDDQQFGAAAGAGFGMDRGIDGAVLGVVDRGDGLPLFPVVDAGVVPGGEGLADAWWSLAEPDVAVFADRVDEFGETRMLANGLERQAVR